MEVDEDFAGTGRWTESPRAFFIERHIADTMRTAHWHDHIEINILLAGSMTYLFNGRQEHVEAGRVVLFWAAIPHQTISVTPDAPLTCVYLPLVDFLALPIDKPFREAVMQGLFIKQRSNDQVTALLASEWSERWALGGHLQRQLIFDEVKLVVRRMLSVDIEPKKATQASSPPVEPDVRHTQALTALINTRFAEKLTLESLAKSVHLHPTTANRAFRNVLGMSVIEYLTRYRVARAMQRLAETQEPVVQIAHDCGFGSNSRFYDVFSRRVGMPPRKFRLAARSA
ncbi:helix-turn-helix domain-containing protein [Agrobacterium sp. S2]|nr:helix-turn-helix domain-containing protein [Agrobacterium sp. S2]